jgi:hypothetical protein
MNWYVWNESGMFADHRGPHKTKAAAKLAVGAQRIKRIGQGLYQFTARTGGKAEPHNHTIYIGSERAMRDQDMIASGMAANFDPMPVEFYDIRKGRNCWRYGKCIERGKLKATVLDVRGVKIELPLEYVRVLQAGS